ncbi:MAG: fused MFS/spermidine synthase, partial [Bacteroidia bacterium]|nr:fused MFS/spermidine synthase [Bacteroidia bacterium]
MTSSKKHLFLFALLEGATVMAVELLAAKMLAPYFGSGLYTWGAVIGVTLVSLSLGYYLGGKTADKYNHQNILYWVILFSSVFIILMPSVSKNLPLSFEHINPITAVVFLSIILILPPLLLLGMVPTLIIRLLSEKVESSGSVTGTVYAISTLGGIFGIFLMGFYIIPEFGLSIPAIITGLILGIITFMLLLMQGKIIVLIYFVVVAFGFLSLKEKKSHSNLSARQAGIKVLYRSEGLLGQILVTDIQYGGNAAERVLFVNRMGQTYIDLNTGKSRWSYVDYLTSAASILPEGSDVLLLGMGGGTVANQLNKILGMNVDAVELDERMVRVAKRFFSLSDNINIIIDDARHYLESTEKTYDLILFDVFKGEVPPSHVLSVECFERARSLLNPGGFIMVNFNGFLNGDAGRAGRSLYKTLKAGGLQAQILPTYEEAKYRNNLFLGMPEPMNFDKVRIPLSRFGTAAAIGSLFVNIKGLNLDDATVFSDDQPLLERYNMLAA